jgi:hypothetical protein
MKSSDTRRASRLVHWFNRLVVLSVTLFVGALVADAYETVADGKYLVNGSGEVFYVRSSMNNLLVNDGTGNNDVIAHTDLFRRSGEVWIAERVPHVGFTTGSYWQSGSYYVTYQVWTDGGTGYKWGKFYALRADDANPNWVGIWGNGLAINLQSSNGQYLCAENGGGSTVAANRNFASAWEEITLWVTAGGTIQSGQEIVLGTRDYQKFFCADQAHADPGRIVADRSSPGPWERFYLVKISGGDNYIRSGDEVALRSSENKYWCANNGGGGTVVANRDYIAAHETFVITFITPGSR